MPIKSTTKLSYHPKPGLHAGTCAGECTEITDASWLRLQPHRLIISTGKGADIRSLLHFFFLVVVKLKENRNLSGCS